MAVRVGRPRVLARFVAIIVAIALIDVSAVAYSRLTYDDSLILPPYARSLEGPVRLGMNDYAASPGSFGFTMTPGRPALPDDGHVRIVKGTRRVTDPDASLRFALAALADYTKHHDSRSLTAATTAAREVAALAHSGLIQHARPRRDPTSKRLLRHWISAETQGLYLSTLSRLYRATGRPTWLRRADRAFEVLIRFRGQPDADGTPNATWFSFVDSGGFLWFEQLPQASLPTQTMTSHISALLGIYDYAQVATRQRRRSAVKIISAAAATSLHYLVGLREPGYAAYTSPRKSASSWDLTHVLSAQSLLLGKITGQRVFTDMAETFANDAYRPTYATTGIALKAGVVPYAGDGLAALPLPGPQTGTDDPDAVLARVITALSPPARSVAPTSVREAASMVDAILATSTHGLLPHRSTTQDIWGRPLAAPWYSAQTQGLMLSALARLSVMTHDARWAREAGAVFATMQDTRVYPQGFPRAIPDVWTSFVVRDHLWFEKFVRNRSQQSSRDEPSFAVDADLAATIGVYDYWQMTGSADAARLLDGALSSLARALPAIRKSGRPSLAELATPGPLPSLDQRRVVVHQLALVASMTDDRRFRTYARLLAADAA